MENNKSIGYMKVETYKGSLAYPVSGATVIVSKKIDQDYSIVTKELTNENGSTKLISLDAESKANSLEENISNPYITYRVEVSKPGYVKKVFDNVPVFEGIITIQSVPMLPDLQNSKSELDYNIPKNELEN